MMIDIDGVSTNPAPPRHALTILAVSDLERCHRFYREAFGWPVRVEVPAYVELELPDGRGLGLYRHDAFAGNTGGAPRQRAAGEITGTEIYLLCGDLDHAIARLEAAGARALSGRAPRPWGDEAAYFADPEGNVLVVARPCADPDVEEVVDGRGRLCREILTALPDWFGIPSAVDQYCRDSEALPSYAVRAGDTRIGFVALKEHFATTTEIYVIGVHPDHHRQGAGRKLIRTAEAYARARGHHLLMVKTMGPSRKNREYELTRAFYLAMGFRPVEELLTLWGQTPCLLLAKPVS
jgi:predicted enzyme related to lactoylglutathione lyase/GNAT superfamily N-acetyltransferase